MPSPYEIKTYQLRVHAGDLGTAARVSILLLDAQGSTIATLYFVESATIPGNSLANPIQGFFPMSSYLPVIDLLRNEKPAYLSILGANIYVDTLPEPVGEGEAAAKTSSPFFRFPPMPV